MKNYKREKTGTPVRVEDSPWFASEPFLEQVVAALFDASEVPMFIHDSAYRIVRANAAYARHAGRPAGTFIGQPYYAVFPLIDGPVACCGIDDGGCPAASDQELVLPDGRRFVLRSYTLAREAGRPAHGLHLLFPAFEFEVMNGQARELARLPDENPHPILRIAGDGRLLFGNPASAFLFQERGLREGERVPEPWLGIVREAFESGERRFLELQAEGRSVGFTLAPAPSAGYVNAYGVDVTEWRRTESLLRHRIALEALVTSIAAEFVNAGAGELDDRIGRALEQAGVFAGTDRCSLFEFSPDRRRISNTHEWCAPGTQRLAERLQELPAGGLHLWLNPLESAELVEIPGASVPPQAVAAARTLLLPDTGAFMAAPLRLDGQLLGFLVFETRVQREWRNEEAYLLKLLAQILAGALARQRSEHERRAVDRALRTLSACNESLVHAADEDTLLQQICDHIVEKGGYRFVWVGFLEEDPDRTVTPVAHAGYEAGYLHVVDVRLADELRGRGPIGQAIGEGRAVVIRDTDDDPCFNPWREEARRRGYRSAIALPLVGEEGGRMGTLTIYAASPHAFDAEEVKLLSDLASDLSFGIHALRSRAARRRAELMLQLRDRAIEASQNAVLITDARRPGTPVIYVNPAFEEITGFSPDEVLGKSPAFLYGPDAEQSGVRELAAAVRNRQDAAVLLRNYRKDGTLFWNDLRVAPVRNDQGEVTHFVGVINDVTERQRYQEQLEHRAHHDDLTGLPNRTLLDDRLEQALIYAERHGRTAAVLFLDIDNFKVINDSLGHRVGDELLIGVGARLRESARRGDTVARYGGDEYVVVLADVERDEEVTQAADQIRREMLRPFDVGGHQLAITFSIGASLYPQDGLEPDTLIRNADTAMYRAKELGRNSVQFYTESLNARLLERLTLESQFRQALDQNRLLLHFQPQLELASGKITGMEALLRWDHPELGLVPPERFIPVAEDTGLIVPVGRWVLHAACSHAVSWQQAGLPPVTVAVNVSARQLQERDFVRQVEAVLRTTGLAPRYLELELTESVVMSDPEVMARKLRQLRELGCHTALDDFGTGYSSLSSIKRFYFDRLKIDRSFVRDITTEPDDAAIARTIITMARGLRLRVIAEGVESEAQLQYLREQGCDEVQGYHISAPLSADEVCSVLRGRAGVRAQPGRASGGGTVAGGR